MASSSDIGSLLRARGAFAIDAVAVPWQRLVAVIGAYAAVYGLVMGLYGGSPEQAFVSALKIPLLILVSTSLCLPSVIVVNAVAGLHRDLPAVLRGILAAQATVAVTLASLSPFLVLLYASTSDYQSAKLCNGLLFLIASIAGQLTLSDHYRSLVLENPRHAAVRRLWWLLYALVTIQMAWVMRPFLGRPGMPVELFRAEAWTNAFVELGRLVGHLLTL